MSYDLVDHIKIIDIKIGTGSDGILYKSIKFQNPVKYLSKDEFGNVYEINCGNSLSGTHICKEYYLINNKKVLPNDKHLWFAKVNDYFQGLIVRKEVKPYTFQNNNEIYQINYINLPVFGNPKDAEFEKIVINTFEKRGYQIANTGKYIRQIIQYI